jgi:hypothetical protein
VSAWHTIHGRGGAFDREPILSADEAQLQYLCSQQRLPAR